MPSAGGSLAVLGLDGMPWGYLERLVEAGVMPYVGQLLSSSFTADLECLPPATPPSWSSIMTGVGPGVHGVFGFFKYERPGLVQRLYTALDLRHPRLHEMLSMLGLRSIVFNPIPDYPVIPLRNTVVVSNLFFTPRPAGHPEGALERFFHGFNPLDHGGAPGCGVVEDYAPVAEAYLAAVEEAVGEEHALLWVNLNVPDKLFHKCPQLLSRGSPGAGEARLFRIVDSIARVLGESHDHLIIVSDHGFAWYDKLASVNDILVRAGLARATRVQKLRDTGGREALSEGGRSRVVGVPPRLYVAVKRLRLDGLARRLAEAYSRLTGKGLRFTVESYVDPEASQAFYPDEYAFGVYLRDKSRLGDVLEALSRHSDALEYMLPEEAYPGPHAGEGPDVVVYPRTGRGYWVTNRILGAPVVRGSYARHHPTGVLIVKTPSKLKSRERGKGGRARLPNHAVARIALQLLGLPLSKHHEPVDLEGLEDPGARVDYKQRWEAMLRVRRALASRGRRRPQS
ncbi:alkaline phosphatase family protein [Stetteria hydrogenophila]